MTAVERITELYQKGRQRMASRQAEKQMRLLETLPLGGKRQLLLIACGEQRFLVGAGSDGVQTIVEVQP